MKRLPLTALLFSLVMAGSAQQIVRYDLTLSDTTVRFGGKPKHALAVNGQIPMPTLVFTQGDTAEIVLHNKSKENTALHWHGVQLPNREDGVPFLTQMPVKPGDTYVYRFPVKQNGTYWYHSHSKLQEQIGMYGSLVFYKRPEDPRFRKGIDDLPTVSLVLSEWTNYKPENIHRMLAAGSDWFAIKKNAVQSYAEAASSGYFHTKLGNEWKRMSAMDVSDVYYDRFLINGNTTSELPQFKAGDKVRLRVANGSSSSYFWLRYAGGKITVIANDGNDVVPVQVDRLIVGVSETYDIVVEVPSQDTAYQLMASSEDRVGYASLFIGSGAQHTLAPLQRLDYFAGMKMMNRMMKMNGDMNDMGMSMSLQKMDMNKVMYPERAETRSMTTLNYTMLQAPFKTTLPPEAPVRVLHFELTGNMNRYVWSMDNRVLSESDKIPVAKGEVLRIVLHNNTMMRHPMHLHGFDFRVLNGHGDYAPLKTVLDILPMETDTVEFQANTEGDWFFHCHILYHMMAGMDRVFSIGDYHNPLLPDPRDAYKMLQQESNMPYLTASNDFASNGNDGEVLVQNARWSFSTEWRLGYNEKSGYESETHIGRYLGRMQWFMPFIGFDWRSRKMGIDEQAKTLLGQKDTKDNRALPSLGFNYTLPMLVIFQTEVFWNGNVRLQLMRDGIPVTRRLRAGFMVNSDKEYNVALQYILSRNLGIRTHYDSDMGFGIGLAVNY